MHSSTPMDVNDVLLDADPAGRISLRLVEKGGQSSSAVSASDGTLRFLAILAALFGPEPASFYFIEELENGIHPTRLSLLVDLIEHQSKRHGVQIVATSHSPLTSAILVRGFPEKYFINLPATESPQRADQADLGDPQRPPGHP